MTSSVTPTLSSPGVGSGLDVTSIVQQLVSSERAAQDKILSGKSTKANTQISALGTFKAGLQSLKDSLTNLSSGGAITQMSARSSDSTIYSASADSTAVAGSYNIEVVSLAQTSKYASTAYASASSVVGEGTVTVGVGADSFTVTLDSGSNSLSALVSAINTASDNKGVNATIVTDVDGAHLMLTSQKTGVANALSISSAATVGGGSFLTMNSIQTAVDAHIRIDGFDSYSASNTVTGAISGLTLNLIKAQPGTSILLTASVNQQAAATVLQNFVTGYNTTIATVSTLTRFDPTGQNTGALIGDSSLTGLVNSLRGITGNSITGVGSQWSLLSQIGITTNTDGTLKLDATKLGTALTQDLGSVQKMFSATGGLSSKISAVLDGYLQTGGRIDAETTSLQSQLKDVTKQQDQLNTRMDALQAQYLTQYSALDTLISQMKQTSSYLTQQLANLPGFTTNSKS